MILQEDPVAQKLLQSDTPARLSYLWRDGSPRVVPMWFHWTGDSFLMGGAAQRTEDEGAGRRQPSQPRHR